MSREQGCSLRVEVQYAQKPDDEIVSRHGSGPPRRKQDWSKVSQQQNEVGKGTRVRMYRIW